MPFALDAVANPRLVDDVGGFSVPYNGRDGAGYRFLVRVVDCADDGLLNDARLGLQVNLGVAEQLLP